MYGLPQAGVLAHKKLTHHLNAAGHKESETAPGLSKHGWRPILLTLVADDFGAECVGQEHANHLIKTLKENYEAAED